jgi:LuxR family maltose regulon positive regulatory protein
LLAISELLAGERDRADDLLADVVEEAIELQASETAVIALGERASIAIERAAWGAAEELADRAQKLIRRSGTDDYPAASFVYVLAARVALHRGETKRGQELLERARPLHLRLTYALPYLAVQARLALARAYMNVADVGSAEAIRREVETILRRQPELGVLVAESDELRAGLETIRAQAPGTASLTTAELRVLPLLATHLSFREIGRSLFISHHTVKSHAMAIYRKLSVISRNEAVERARELGLG